MEEPAQMFQAFRQRGYKLANESQGDRLLQLAAELSVDAAWLAGRFEVFMSTRAYTKEVHEDLLDEYEEFARQEGRRESKLKAREAKTPAVKARPGVLADHTNTGTPKLSAGKPPQKSRLQGILPSPAGEAKQGGGIVSSFNSHLTFPDRGGKGQARAERPAVTQLGGGVTPSQTFLMDRLQDRVAYLEDGINRFADAVEQAESISLANSVHAPAQEPLWYAGRICCDSEGRLNESSVLLEGGIRHSQGHRVRLDLSKLPAFRLFPGQAVAVEGVNPNGDRLIALRLIASRPLPPAAPLGPPGAAAGALSAVIAAGPFTAPGDLAYGPLQALLAFVAKSRPGLLLLLGPFVDAEHPAIAGGLVERTFEDIFEQEVLGPLAAVGPGTTVALLPATRDAHSLPVFPQPPLEAGPEAELPEHVLLLGNPASFECGGASFGAVTTDVLKHLSSQEIDRGAGSDRIAGLASHITAQGSYYPLFPPALGTMLDTRLAGSLQLPGAPDVLLLPSDLNAFAKRLGGPEAAGVALNPGRLQRGSFAHLQAAAGKEGGEEAFAARCRVDIRQL